MNLRLARKKKGLTQYMLGKKLAEKMRRKVAFSQKTISFWENGREVPSEPELKALYEILELPGGGLHFLPRADAVSDFWEVLVAGGLEKADMDLLQQNPILHKPLADAVTEFCAKMRKVVQP